MLFYKWFIWFILYSFIGWAFESIQFTFLEKKFVNRGFLIGPICPVYGFGALLLLLVLDHRTDNTVILFFSAMALTTTLEYCTAILLEKLFHARWWDYSNFRLNFQGRICLLGAVAFATMSVIQIKYFHPFVRSMTDKLPASWLPVLSYFIFMLLILDFSVTVRHVLVLNGRLSEIQTAINGFLGKYARRAGELKNSLLDNFEESEFYSERIKTLLKLDRFQNRRIFRAFPKLRSVRYDDALKKLKETLLGPKRK